ncbi:hypothetical protein M422DRAFT_274703 [Sphaerobolus stellatus SS14]|uniref:DDE Tnp4 domain-containing protein n=1 Tax=Sphaerobolus stellatus (strain SS14) TaxID=990650 RepID=A0A0C9T6G0_SPHS4|nr:hypothetical protein M422DRAFT_274703 [Sphaerobolus stellatus SS14]
MEEIIIARRLSFYNLMEDLAEELVQELLVQHGRFREGGKINLFKLGDVVWKDQFRFTHAEVEELVVVLDLPTEIKLAWPSRLCDVEMQFGWERSHFSRITHVTASFLLQQWKHLLHFDPTRLTREKLSSFAQAINAKGAPTNSPDGLIIHMYGPVDGRRHDETVYKESGLAELLDKHFWTPNGDALFIYRDPAYTVAAHVMSPFKGPAVSRQERAFNTAMSQIRTPVEWLFKEILLSPCGLFYLVAILCNAHTILHHPQIPQYFAYPPPSLQEYFTGGPIDDAELDKWCLDSMWGEAAEEEVEEERLDEEEG